MLLALTATGGLVRLQTGPQAAPDPEVAAAQAARALSGQKVTSLKISFFDQAGLDVTGDLTVTAGGTTTGKLADSGGGSAEYLASGGDTAVRGDQDWWARRDPARVGALQAHWVRPKDYAFPLENDALTPKALASMIEWVRDGGTPATGTVSVAGRAVVGMRRDGWTVLFSREKPYRLVWFGGPLQDGTPLTQTDSSAPQTPPYVSALVDPSPGDAPKAVFPADAREEDKVAANLPAFDVTVNATTCRSVTCSWSVTVTNTGTAAGDASVIASVSPGMPKTQVKALGKLSPGQTVTTPKMSFPNPAATNKDVAADYRAQIYCPELHGSALNLMRRLQEKGLVPGRSRILGRLDSSQTSAMLFTLDAMGKVPRFDADKAIDAMENAVTLGVLPEVGELIRSRRLENPAILYTKLPNPIFEYDTGTPGTPVNGKTGYRRQLQVAAGVLREDPDATVKLDSKGVDILVHTSGQRTYAIQVKSVSSDSVTANLQNALKELEAHAPSGSTRVALLHVDAAAGFAHAAGRDYFDGRMRALSAELCLRSADEVVVVNQTGVERWNYEQLPGCR
ncbi:hypothetical protein [Actinoplanes regularis]|uniref:Uncharacterized protein n=1 Tax=Actinoplanes regularis TaxID=52697 RepID=A0A239I6C1_9ACTN|nr:hypothetical protein [Actinoplanes regularis]GIE91325.1 hypothetical protein Are01nite_78050 [Actinoplanes regularis]SNS89107.1 hypothetical protein SAMN06264365_127107 [Actinoplanes regularis]